MVGLRFFCVEESVWLWFGLTLLFGRGGFETEEEGEGVGEGVEERCSCCCFCWDC